MADKEMQNFINLFEKKIDEAKTKYEDSTDFTAEMDKVSETIFSDRFSDWMKSTDSNFDTECVSALADLRKAMKKLETEIMKAE